MATTLRLKTPCLYTAAPMQFLTARLLVEDVISELSVAANDVIEQISAI